MFTSLTNTITQTGNQALKVANDSYTAVASTGKAISKAARDASASSSWMFGTQSSTPTVSKSPEWRNREDGTKMTEKEARKKVETRMKKMGRDSQLIEDHNQRQLAKAHIAGSSKVYKDKSLEFKTNLIRSTSYTDNSAETTTPLGN